MLLIGGSVLALVLVVVATLAGISRYYKKAAPNEAAVITGGKYGKGDQQRGFRVVVGGGFFLMPIIEEMEVMKLNVMTVEVTCKNVPDKNGALVEVRAIANVKIRSEQDFLPLAVERFLGMKEQAIIDTMRQTLEGNLRGIVGTLTVEELLQDRTAFTQKVLEEAGTDLGKMGIGVDVLKIQDIKDERGYIDSLGKKRTAEVVRDAAIGEAEAQRETAMKTAEARRAGEVATAEADKAISDANRDRDVAVANNDALVAAQQAQIPIAAQIAEAARNQDLKVAIINADKAEAEAGIALEEVQARRNTAHLQATVVVTAEKQREAAVITADAERQAAELEGEAFRIKSDKEGQGEKLKQTGIADGRKALAEAEQVELEAKAAGEKAGLLAVAAGKQADLEAVAAGELAMAAAVRARLLAEAEGIEKKAQAFKELDDAGRFLMILEALPPVIAAAGAALEQATRPMAEAIGQGLGNIDELRLIDLGAGNTGSNGSTMLSRFANQPNQLMFTLWEQAKSLGIDKVVLEIAKKAGIDVDTLAKQAAANAAKPVGGDNAEPEPATS